MKAAQMIPDVWKAAETHLERCRRCLQQRGKRADLQTGASCQQIDALEIIQLDSDTTLASLCRKAEVALFLLRAGTRLEKLPEQEKRRAC